ncbi:hypothetical protein HWB19_gp065 [Cronobacter phage vB_CsaP_009]|uniref:Uncharacterized protein n=1 Tax=Cronobacter phage vB_CsaP_009 TaxID=2699738 RepID=A0A679FGB5_9CAUD|nr:hypothetical protein HWB19_gp065 [Cronobacter phage vB_CsaP_009]BBU72711.1 hypothetical protein [Cronobacter phage vB_CsaP_009]
MNKITAIDVTNKAIELKNGSVSFMTSKVDYISIAKNGTCTLLCRSGQSYSLNDSVKSVLNWLKETGINAGGSFDFKLTAVNPIWSYKGLRLGHVYTAKIDCNGVAIFEDGKQIAIDVNLNLINYKVVL